MIGLPYQVSDDGKPVYTKLKTLKPWKKMEQTHQIINRKDDSEQNDDSERWQKYKMSLNNINPKKKIENISHVWNHRKWPYIILLLT